MPIFPVTKFMLKWQNLEKNDDNLEKSPVIFFGKIWKNDFPLFPNFQIAVRVMTREKYDIIVEILKNIL